MLRQETSDKRQEHKEYKATYCICKKLELDLKRVLVYPLTSVPLTFAHIYGLKMSTDKSTLFSKLEVRIITDATRNIDACIVDGMFLLHSHVDLPSPFSGQANVTLSDVQIMSILHVTFLNIHQLMIAWFGIGRGKCIWT